MKTARIDIQPLAGALDDFVRAWKTGKADKEARISFATPELLWEVLTAKRWALLRTMAGQGPMALREAARRVGRDVKSVHGDVHALLKTGILRKTDTGAIVFPWTAIHVDVLLKAA